MDTIEVIQKMLESDKSNPSTWYLLGVEYKRQNLFEQALQAFSEAVKTSDAELKEKIFRELSELNLIYHVRYEEAKANAEAKHPTGDANGKQVSPK